MVTRLRKLPQWLRLIAGHLLLIDSDRRQVTLVTSMDLADHPTLRVILGRAPAFHSRLLPSRAALYIGWGRKWSGRRAVAIAEATGTDFCLLEDGFLRSVERGDLGLSLIFDHEGIYYDATGPSALEEMIAATLPNGEEVRASAIMSAWRDFGLSKFNAARDHEKQLPPQYVLVADQVAGDLSIEFGLADVAAFERMLEAALEENPNKTIVVKLHPDALKRPRRRHFDPEILGAIPRLRVILDNCHVAHLIKNADAVYTVTSQVGFEALIWGKRVRCFGMPFYAGWGLTDDELPAPKRRKPVALEQLVHAALVKYPRYIDPVTMTRCEPECSFAHVGLQRRKRQEFPEQILAIGFSRWKRLFIQRFLQGSYVVFAKTPPAVSPSQSPLVIALWGSADAPALPSNATILRMEDGFLRSSGLGADLVRPLSLVIDDIGIHYDATRPSRLERILETQVLDHAAVLRADELRDRIIELDLTKYNLGNETWDRPNGLSPVILVVGQVETDASIRLGSPEVRSNVELLRRVRQENPSAHIVYKPHPDVLAGLRRQGDGERDVLALADEVLARPVSLGQLLGQVDEVHTMTSLLGFEALIRGVKVVCHGLPFYAGWGLTEDRIPCLRRTRRLTVAELVHGALISYPRYFNYERDCFVEPEQAVEQLAAMANRGPQRRNLHRKFLRSAILAWLKLKGNTR
ncbi:capsular polysaccharide biosynthesis protein [Pontitalea aquivivens]|uniref:capsular polysaccharide biosynthesis protein n=1 Tax=Pontitalea aquivivens TaxID=3388663 RepID=UPI003970B1D0